MKMIASFDPTAASSGTFNPLVSNPCGRIYLFNESAVGLLLTFQDGSVAGLPPYYFRSYHITKPGTVIWKQNYTIATGASPLSVVVGEAYESAETKNVNWTEGPLNRQTSIGNTIPVGTSVTNIINDGNPANTTVVEATQASAIGSNLLLENDGTITVREGTTTLLDLFKLVTGASIAVLLGSATRAVQAVGDLFINTGKIGVTAAGDVLDASGAIDTYLKTRSGSGNINFQVPNGTTQFSIGNGGPTIASGNHLTWGTGDTLSQTKSFFGTGSVTVSHGMNGSPFMVAVTCHVSGSQTQGYDSENATTVHITSGSGLAWKAIGFLG